jgi:predicted nucleic acid-binding Zn finger protein
MKIQSMSNKAVFYEVLKDPNNEYTCTCPNWFYRLKDTNQDCKHIMRLKNDN